MIRFERHPNFTRAAGRGIREWEWDENGNGREMEMYIGPGKGTFGGVKGGLGGDQVEGRRKGGPTVRQGVESRVGHGGPRVERGEARFGACGAHCSTGGGAEGVGRGRMVVHVGD